MPTAVAPLMSAIKDTVPELAQHGENMVIPVQVAYECTPALMAKA